MIEINAVGERKIRIVAAQGSAPAGACGESRPGDSGANGVIATTAR
jgi:hypothetical protein